MAMDMVEEKLIMAICTPLMKRVHTDLRHAGELVFMDSSSNMDRHGCSVFIILTHSCAGGLPLGVLITTSESQSIIKAALQLYCGLLPDGCFGGKGKRGPSLFMTDDCHAEQQAIQDVFPETVCLLCIFHVLQAAWRWLWNGKNAIPKYQRPSHLQHLKRLVYADSEDELENLYQESLQDEDLSE